MPRYKQICLSGLDRCGKATQARLLSRALTPSKLYSFPDYSSWSGRLIGAILKEQELQLSRDGGLTSTTHRPEKEPYIFQALQFANVRQHTAGMLRERDRQHLVLDRGPECALAFGLVDGCDLSFLLELQRQLPVSDLVFCLMGRPIPRPHEVPDQNERDEPFQARVAEAYRGLCQLFPERFVPVLVDGFRDADPACSMTRLHRHLVSGVNRLLPAPARVQPLSEGEVRATLGLPQPGQPPLPGLEPVR